MREQRVEAVTHHGIALERFGFNLDIDGALHFRLRTLQERLTFGHATRTHYYSLL
ncbi:MAG: hypothetical protein F6K50_26890 [Moorea sp. SIO3I7]|uniref:hypothetical protein n=1 Tax=unclassified Moorena TaxID=2683338 RepID=UPI0013C588B6|nr:MULTISPECIES: hypothetical protein [unclassified Moorena]NEN98988.1 hypothetical protein [Moorena sp. SIO3I7]NEO13217.1 hypothetical protein [Moorena sp. SIO3E8]NEQ01064.1 hypothetical protein [Moorena sp. SIO3F7]